MRWGRITLALLLITLLGLFANARPTAADEGYNVAAPITGTAWPAVGASQDGSRICVVFGQYVAQPQIYLRVYNVGAKSWTPPLNAAPFQVSGGADKEQIPHCTFDGKGNLHVAWQQGAGALSVAHRWLPAGGDPANSGSWSGITIVQGDGDASDIDALQSDGNGRVWLAYRKYNAQSGLDIYLHTWTQESGWSGPQVIGSGDSSTNATRVAVDNSGFVHILYAFRGQAAVYYAFRDPGSGQLRGPFTVPNSNGAPRPDLTVDRVSGRVHVVFSKNFDELHYNTAPGHGNADFAGDRVIARGQYFLDTQVAWSPTGRIVIVADDGPKVRLLAVTSDDNGTNWNTTVVTSPGGGLEAPAVAADSAGNAYIVYAHHSGDNVYFTVLPAAAPPTPPAIGAIGARINGLTNATITWETDQPATSRVFYGTANPPDTNCSSEGNCTVASADLVSTHILMLRNLSPNTTYYFQVRSTNKAGVSSVSGVNSFTTPHVETIGGAGLVTAARNTIVSTTACEAMARSHVALPAAQLVAHLRSVE